MAMGLIKTQGASLTKKEREKDTELASPTADPTPGLRPAAGSCGDRTQGSCGRAC